MKPTLRTAALLLLAGFAVHQTRYALVPDRAGDGAHAYLHAAPVVLALLAALALGRTLATLGRRAGAVPAVAAPVARWLAASGALLVLHAAQEGAERLLAGGGPLDAGVLVVVPLCLAAGAVVAYALRHADELLFAASSAIRAALRAAAPAERAASLPPDRPAFAREGGLARHLAGRAPPVLG
ncbi:MAG: hypothetical protein E6G10_08015 [Actinobacteria bacterium]|nr:MAG: hypothetical protein E6G10_08015 [Actinomycetota bacterium]